VNLRCVTLNLWGAEPPLEARMRLALDGLRALDADVVALQEVREIRGRLPNQAATLGQELGLAHVFAPAVVSAEGEYGLALLSRFAIADAAPTRLPHPEAGDDRILLSARLTTPVGDVWAHSTHLDYRLDHGKQREDQVMAIHDVVAAKAAPGPQLPQILMGDFNATPDADEIRWLTGMTTLGGRRVLYQDAWARTHPAEPGGQGWTWASANPFTRRLAFLHPDRRIDYIFVTPMRSDGRGTIRSCRVVLDTPGADGNHASDHYGVLAEIQVTPE
jgi:endonuclease/exonuclease/phosphatase family metal-dependent hydrolase